MKKKYDVNVIGLGYIGLPTAALLAKNGFRVAGIDLNEDVVTIVNSGKVHIVEPDLESEVEYYVKNNFLHAFNKVQPADIYIICVPTPLKDEEGRKSPNIDYVIQATNEISCHIKDEDIVILESTSPIGTTELVKKILNENNKSNNFYVAHCPERVLPGNIMHELIHNPRIIGGVDNDSTEATSKFYKKFVKGEILKTNSRTAEMCKLTENSFRDTNLAFANELSIISEENEVNVWELIELANKHPRVNILNPGCGVGGHCIAIDPWFLVASNTNSSKLIKTSRNINDSKPEWVIDKIIEYVKTNLTSMSKIACLGLSFKPDIDDLRSSPALKIAQALTSKFPNVMCVEPNIDSESGLDLVNLDFAIANADLLVILVGHKEFLEEKNMDNIKKLNYLDFCGAIESRN